MKLTTAVFTFTINNTDTYSAHWYINTTAIDLNRKYEVAIFYGGGYLVSYYTDHRICEKNSREFIEKYLSTKN